MATFDLVVVGDANPDVLITGAPANPPFGQSETLVDTGVLTLGGSAAIVAHGAARLGLSTALSATVGRDAAGDFVLDMLFTAGVDISAVVRDDRLPTALTVCLGGPGGDRAILTATGCLSDFEPKTLPPARHVHAAAYYLQPRMAARLTGLLREARESGGSTSLDTNDDPARRWDLAPGLLDACDFILPNETEALALTGTDSVDAALASFARTGVVPVIKRAHQGAIARVEGETLIHRGVPEEPVDTVGAGDSFDAGFLAGLLNTGDIEQALAVGCACGALSTRAIGGTAGQPTWAQAVASATSSQYTGSQCDP
ncbi:carbohydrate kinase family protein [Nocardia sp. NPDC004722]